MTFQPPRQPASQTPSELPRGTIIARKVFGWLFWAIVLPIPLFLALMGAWIGGTLAIFHDGPVWLALLGALVVFAALPYVWELAADRKQVGGRARDAILRSSFFSIVLIVVLLLTHGKTTYTALATRGDWFLANAKTPAAESIRRFMFDMAERFHGLDSWREEFSYAWAGTTEGVDPTGSAAKLGTLLRTSVPDAWRKDASQKTATGSTKNTGTTGVTPVESQPRPPAEPEAIRPPGFVIEGTSHTWPLPPEPHPLVVNMPEEAKVSIKAVGAYLKTSEPDEFMRAKAVHDFVAGWVKYDSQGILDGTYSRGNRQSAAVVFKTRTGVCAKYAALTEAIGKAAGLKTVVVVGTIRWNTDYKLMTPEDVEAGKRKLPVGEVRGHAWNAMEVNGRWFLLDTTWDNADDEGKIRSRYLFIPAEAMLTSHFPDNKRWQLLTEPLTFGAWLRLPTVGLLGIIYGVRPINHVRPVVEYQKDFRLELENPYRAPATLLLVKDSFVSLTEVLQIKPGQALPRGEEVRCGSYSDSDPLVFECPGLAGGFSASYYLQPFGEKGAYYPAGQVTVDGP